MAAAARNLTPVVLELGGKDPMVVLRDANVELFTKLADLKRRRPPSETLARLDRQLVLPLFTTAPPKKNRMAAFGAILFV